MVGLKISAPVEPMPDRLAAGHGDAGKYILGLKRERSSGGNISRASSLGALGVNTMV